MSNSNHLTSNDADREASPCCCAPWKLSVMMVGSGIAASLNSVRNTSHVAPGWAAAALLLPSPGATNISEAAAGLAQAWGIMVEAAM